MAMSIQIDLDIVDKTVDWHCINTAIVFDRMNFVSTTSLEAWVSEYVMYQEWIAIIITTMYSSSINRNIIVCILLVITVGRGSLKDDCLSIAINEHCNRI